MLRRLALSHVRVSYRASPRPWARRLLSDGKPTPKPTPPSTRSPEGLSREDVEALASGAKAGQRLVDMENSMFGGNMSMPVMAALIIAIVALFVEVRENTILNACMLGVDQLTHTERTPRDRARRARRAAAAAA